MSYKDTDNSADTLDIRYLIERIEELRGDVHFWRVKLCDFAGIDKEDTFATHTDASEALAEWLDDHAEFYARTAEKEACMGLAIDIRAMKDGETFEGGVGDTALIATIEANEPEDGLADELATLESFIGEMKGNGGDHQWEGDWYPVTLIRDSYWTDYVQDYADDIHGEGMRDAQWPMNCIDWGRAGDVMQMDYSSADYDGVTYWYR